jgi:hypothetical protein
VSDSLLRKYADARTPPTDRERLAAQLDGDAADDLGCFGWLRSVRERAILLELRKRTGDIRAVAYAWIECAEFDPSGGVTLLLPGKPIHIRGRNLNAEMRPTVRLFQGIVRHRVPWIQEAGEQERMISEGTTTLVERIEW